MRLLSCLVLVVCASCSAPLPPVDHSGPTAEWPAYGGDQGGLRFSPLTQITAENVGHLELAWEHRHGDVSDGTGDSTRTSFQATPIVADGSLYFCTGFNRVLALDPETGEERWAFDPQNRVRKLQGPYPRVCRGVAYWKDAKRATGQCSRRIFTATLDSELIALDAESGEPGADFGEADACSFARASERRRPGSTT